MKLPKNADDLAALSTPEMEEFLGLFNQTQCDLTTAQKTLQNFGFIRKGIILLVILVAVFTGIVPAFDRFFAGEKQAPNAMIMQNQVKDLAEKLVEAAEKGAAKATLTTTLTDEQQKQFALAVSSQVGKAPTTEEIASAIVKQLPPQAPQQNVSAFVNGILDLVLAPGGIKVDGGALITSVDEKSGTLSMEFKPDPATPVAKK